MFISPRLNVVVLGLVFGILAGCSDKAAGRLEVTGKVKFGGQQLKEGTVSFEPLDGQGTRATAVITAGEYTIPKTSGLLPGKYLIRISAGDGTTPVNPVNADEPPSPTGSTNIISKDLIPADWNVNSKQERTLSKDGPKRLDFEIP